MVEMCLICDKTILSDRSVVHAKGMEGLLNASIARQDGKSHVFRKETNGVVHNYCRKNYTRPDTIASDLRNNVTTPEEICSRRSSDPKFEFKQNCFFCCEVIDEMFHQKQRKKTLERREKVFEVRSLGLKDNILKAARERGDEWGEQISRRIGNVSDLVAAHAIYHDSCCKKFYTKKRATEKRGRPSDDYVTAAMEDIYKFLDEGEDCQYSMDEVMDAISGEKPSIKTVKDKLKEKYGENLIISQLQSHKTVLCFKDVGDKILNASWYDRNSRGKTPEEERRRIVLAAAAIIKDDIQSQPYDTTHYPPSDGFLNQVEEMVHVTLQIFMEELLCSRKQDNIAHKRKAISLSHSIISVVRPRSFISPIMHGLAFFIHRKYGSKNLVNLLASLGFSASYNDAQILEVSAIHNPQQLIPPGVFMQYVFDNADYNVATLDGLKTFHSMGGISCLTPAHKLPPALMIERMKKAPAAKSIGTLGVIPLEMYENVGKVGLKSVIVEDMRNYCPVSDFPFPNLPDVLWFLGKWLRIDEIPEWKGYIRGLCVEKHPEKSAILPLPFINAQPSDNNTIYTALKYAAMQSNQQGMRTCYVTFDQPLYIKAREIVASCQDDVLMKSVVVRLGGFHLLMSYLGCIGHIMAGSGLKEALCTVFAPNTVDKMMTGHAFGRAVRGHLLVQMVLAEIILNNLEVSDEQKNEITQMLGEIKSGTLNQGIMNQNVQLGLLQGKMKESLLSLKDFGPTSALWVQYFHMVSLMKQFIEAERSGNWEMHLCSVQQMIPFFHASGHLQYAKCAHLYVQDMYTLPTTHPHDFNDFAKNFSVSRSDLPGSGNWSDMTIELTLMRSMKTHGGLTSGRGITDATLAKWVGGAATSTSICSTLEDFAGLHYSTGEQHVDYRVSRQTRDNDDREKLFLWFSQHPPFPQSPELISLATGIVANCNVNCHKALEEGKNIMRKAIGQKFGDIKLARKDKVLSLASMNNTVKINDIAEVVDPLLIFQRVSISKKNDDDLQDLLRYELAPVPLALFDERGMRKTNKSSLYDIFPLHEVNPDLKLYVNVVDGGFLIHRVKWDTGSTFSAIIDKYVSYIKNHYGECCTVVFDGYSHITNSTKRAEQQRRLSTKTVSVDIDFTEEMKVTVQQENFLCNDKNKARLISMLSQKLITEGIEVKQAEADADTTVVQCAVEKAVCNCNVAIIGEDVDLLVLLVALAPQEREVIFFKPGKGKVESRTYSSVELQKYDFARNILFIHGFSGCDTTSSIYRKGKLLIAKLFSRDSSLDAISNIFYRPNSTQQEVSEAGEMMFLAMYKSTEKDLDKHRYIAFMKSTTRVKPDLPSLPPSKGSAQQHSYRVYLQIQEWLGNKLQPTEWGWTTGTNGQLKPLTTVDPAAPAAILKSIFCNCTKGCGSRCGCRKAGIRCSAVCGNCEGVCTNGPPVENDDTEDPEDPMDSQD